MAAKKQLTAAQGMDAACILFELNSKREHIVNLAFGAEIPEACLTEPGALPDFCAEWRAFVHATVTAGLMQHAPNSVLVGYLRRTGELLAATAKAEGASLHTQAVPVSEDSLNAFVDGPFAAYMPLLAQEKQHQCPVLFCRRLGYDEDSRITPDWPRSWPWSSPPSGTNWTSTRSRRISCDTHIARKKACPWGQAFFVPVCSRRSPPYHQQAPR